MPCVFQDSIQIQGLSLSIAIGPHNVFSEHPLPAGVTIYNSDWDPDVKNSFETQPKVFILPIYIMCDYAYISALSDVYIHVCINQT